MSGSTLLKIEHLCTSFFTDKGEVKAVQDVSFTIEPGKVLALVGESGCGKSVTAFSIMGLLSHPGRITNGRILFEGRDLAALNNDQMREIRGNRIGMIFQEPMTSLNPVLRIGDQIAETLREHRPMSDSEIRRETARLLELVQIPSPERRITQYPHELSGGMKQRVMIAMALACGPDLLIADEPTTALDVTIQAQILELLKHLQEELGMAILLITHNLGIVAQYAQDVSVMYAGRIVEQADVYGLFGAPRHPYTVALLNALPRNENRKTRLAAIEGMVPSPLQYPPGCHFAPRCAQVLSQCRTREPDLYPVGGSDDPGHTSACWLHRPADNP